ncbi:MAG TPA: hypothetical protein VLB76_02620 [Thermoanaerobaculia bacterium]|jgi:hypothetical protein|nr:hypothetical protein [Thermoanaerobaculia bacterium]
MRQFLVSCLVSFSISTAATAAWVPTDCSDKPGELERFHQALGRNNVGKIWNDYREAVRKATPGSPLYAPHPYPRNDQEVIDNFRYAYFNRLFRETSLEKLPSREIPIYKALSANALRAEVLKVENWDLSRCTANHPHPYYNLLRFFDPATGVEVARSEQFDTGLMASYRHVSSKEEPLPALGALSTLLRTRFNRTIPVEQPQYVMVAGLPSCGENHPCVAFKSQGQVYLLDDGRILYQIDPTMPRTSVQSRMQQQARAGIQTLGATEFDRPMITLGFEWGMAQRIAGEAPKTRNP